MSKTIDERIKALDERIAVDTAKREELKATKAAADRLASIQAGAAIRFTYGRGENRGEFAGVVRGLFDTDKGRVVRVIKGDGVDEEIVTIRPADILGVGEDVQQTEVSNAQDANADPLASIN